MRTKIKTAIMGATVKVIMVRAAVVMSMMVRVVRAGIGRMIVVMV